MYYLQILVQESFEANGEQYQAGETPDIDDDIAKAAIEKGVADKVEKLQVKNGENEGGENMEKIDTNNDNSSSNPPRYKNKVWISDERNIEILVWEPQPDSKYDSPSVQLKENRKNDDGEWEEDTIYMPTGAGLLALSEDFTNAWNAANEIKAELK